MNEVAVRAQTQDPVLAIWNTALTLKICLGGDIVQEETRCEGTYDHDDDDGESDEEPVRCDEWAWPRYDGPIVVSGDGVAHFCEDCVREIDPEFVDLYEDVFSDERKFADAIGERLYYEDGLERFAAHFPPDRGVIERGPRPASS